MFHAPHLPRFHACSTSQAHFPDIGILVVSSYQKLLASDSLQARISIIHTQRTAFTRDYQHKQDVVSSNVRMRGDGYCGHFVAGDTSRYDLASLESIDYESICCTKDPLLIVRFRITLLMN